MRRALIDSARDILEGVGRPADDRARLESQGDPNDWRVVRDGAPGIRYTPLTTRDHARMGARERVLDVQQRHPDRLRIEMHALATRVLFDGTRAVGVEYRKGERLYRAHARPSAEDGEVRQAHASREVILAGGRVQHAAVADALGHRRTRCACAPRDRSARRSPRRGQEPAGPL